MTMCLPCAIAFSAWAMPASGMPVASTIDLDAGERDQRLGVGGDVQAAPLQCVAERRRGEGLGRPAGARQLAASAPDIEIGDADDVHALRAPRLRQEHGAELAGADQADRHRPAGRFALEQQGMQVHGRPYFTGTTRE